MSVIDEALSANVTIAHGYDPSRGKPQAPKIAIVTCADPRLSSIEQMLGLATQVRKVRGPVDGAHRNPGCYQPMTFALSAWGWRRRE
jgi:hypothetical protein